MQEIKFPLNKNSFVSHIKKMSEADGINAALTLSETPVFFITRHGRYKKCFSRNTAINHLAHFMTHKVFERAGA